MNELLEGGMTYWWMFFHRVPGSCKHINRDGQCKRYERKRSFWERVFR